ncbi:MAG: flagellar biosynthetic protein FliR [Pirellulaceae bacterium]
MIDNQQLVLFMMILARVASFVATFPLFSRRQLPQMVKVGLSVALSIFWFGEIEAQFTGVARDLSGLNTWMSILLIVKECTIGIALGTILGSLFWPAKIAGSYVGQELGLSLASISDPGSQDSSTLLTRIFESLAILVFFAINMHHFLVLALHESFSWFYTQVGVLDFPTEQIVSMFNDSSDYGLLICAPLLIVSMLVTTALAFLNKAAPSLNLFSVGMPLRAGLGIFLLVLFSPVLFTAIEAYFYRVQDDITEFFRLMGTL